MERTFETTVIKPPWAEVTPVEALHWLGEFFQDWGSAGRTLVVHSEISRDTVYWILGDVQEIACACSHSIKTQEPVKIVLGEDSHEPEQVVDMLAQAVQLAALEAIDGGSYDALIEWSRQLVERVAVSPAKESDEEPPTSDEAEATSDTVSEERPPTESAPQPSHKIEINLIGKPGEHKIEPPEGLRWLHEDLPALLGLIGDGLTEGADEYHSSLVCFLDDVARYVSACTEAVTEQRPVTVSVDTSALDIPDHQRPLAEVMAAQNLDDGSGNPRGFKLVSEFLLQRCKDDEPLDTKKWNPAMMDEIRKR